MAHEPSSIPSALSKLTRSGRMVRQEGRRSSGANRPFATFLPPPGSAHERGWRDTFDFVPPRRPEAGRFIRAFSGELIRKAYQDCAGVGTRPDLGQTGRFRADHGRGRRPALRPPRASSIRCSTSRFFTPSRPIAWRQLAVAGKGRKRILPTMQRRLGGDVPGSPYPAEKWVGGFLPPNHGEPVRHGRGRRSSRGDGRVDFLAWAWTLGRDRQREERGPAIEDFGPRM